MPLIILTGLPSSGKTHRATQIAEFFTSRTTTTPHPRARKVTIISDHTLSLRRSAYAHARTEKDARAALLSAVRRHLGRSEVVILDSGCYIKGWRYQLYCEAKNLGTPSCVVHVGTPVAKCREVNGARTGECGGAGREDAWEGGVFEELVMRYEEPSGMARWDRPLWTVVWEDERPAVEEMWRELVEGVGKDGREVVVRPNLATVVAPAAKEDHLYELERSTTAILSQLQTYISNHPGESGGSVSIPTSLLDNDTASSQKTSSQTLEIELPMSQPSLPQLQRLKRQFVALHRQQMGSMGMGTMGAAGAAGGSLDVRRVAEMFVEWLNDTFSKS